MPKDSQVDKKEIRKKKANGNENTIASEDGKNKNKTIKKQSANRNDV